MTESAIANDDTVRLANRQRETRIGNDSEASGPIIEDPDLNHRKDSHHAREDLATSRKWLVRTIRTDETDGNGQQRKRIDEIQRQNHRTRNHRHDRHPEGNPKIPHHAVHAMRLRPVRRITSQNHSIHGFRTRPPCHAPTTEHDFVHTAQRHPRRRSASAPHLYRLEDVVSFFTIQPNGNSPP